MAETTHRQWACLELEKFRSVLDAEIFDLMKKARSKKGGLKSAYAYNFFAGAGSPDPCRASLWRKQAVAQYPILAAAIRHSAELCRCIDNGFPLVPALAEGYGVSAVTVRALAGEPFGPGERPTRIKHIMEIVDTAPPDWIPRDQEGWRRLRSFTIYAVAVGLVSGRVLTPGIGKTEALQNSAALRQMLQGVIRRNGPGWCTGMSNSPDLAHLRDTAFRLMVAVIIPFLVAGEWLAHDGYLNLESLRRIGLLLLSGSRSPAATLAVSRRHLDRILGLGRLAPLPGLESDHEEGWLTLADDAVSPDGVKIRNLLTEEELRQEGQVMSHCVGDYGQVCRNGVSRILSLSVRDKTENWVNLSTAEITVAGDLSLKIRQHYAQGNKPPKSSANEALRWYLTSVHCGEIKGNVAALARRALELRTMVAPHPAMADRDYYPGYPEGVVAAVYLDAHAGYDWRSVADRQAKWAIWTRHLDDSARRQPVAGWLATCLPNVVESGGECVLGTALKAFLDFNHAAAAA